MPKQVLDQMVVQLQSGETLDLRGWSVLYPLPRLWVFGRVAHGSSGLFESAIGHLVIKDELLEVTPSGPLKTAVFYDARAPQAVEWLRTQPKGHRAIKKHFSRNS